VVAPLGLARASLAPLAPLALVKRLPSSSGDAEELAHLGAFRLYLLGPWHLPGLFR